MRLERKTIAIAALSAAVVGLAAPPLVEAGQTLLIPRNSVGTEQLKANAVTRGKIKNGQVTSEKLAKGVITATQLADRAVGSAKIQDGSVAVADLAPQPGAGLSAGANQDVPPGATVAIAFDQVRHNLLGAYSAANPTRITAPVTGVYVISATVAWSLLGDNTARKVELRRNGGPVIAQDVRTDVNAAVRVIHTATEIARLTKGDYVEVTVTNSSASGTQIVPIGELSPEFQLQFLSPA